MDKFDKGFPVPETLNATPPPDLKGWTRLEVTAAQAFELMTGSSPRDFVYAVVMNGSAAFSDPVNRLHASIAAAGSRPVFVPHDDVPGVLDRGTLYLPPAWPVGPDD
jgi:hypothetical protein